MKFRKKPATGVAEEPDKHAAFESWCMSNCGFNRSQLARLGDGYCLPSIDFMWKGYAAHAVSQSQVAAVRTLERLGYAYYGGVEWKPPRGERPAWLDPHFDGSVDEKALATAQEIALMWGRDRSQFVSRIQVAVRSAMDWMRRAAPPVEHSTSVDDLAFTQTTDARQWAEAFQRIVLDKGVLIDVDLMIGWFANAIERGRDAGAQRPERDDGDA